MTPELFDPAVFLVLPGSGRSAMAKSDLSPCGCCGEEIFEVVARDDGRTSVECPTCREKRGRKRAGRLLGAVNMRTGKTKEAK